MPKRFYIFSILIFSFLKGLSAEEKPSKDSITILIKLDNRFNNNLPVDSVLMIFDKYDHTGAGIIKQIFHPHDNYFEVTVPKGKYFVDLFCLGLFADKHFDIILRAKSNKKIELQVKLNPSAFFTPGFAYIPEEKIDLSNLSVTKYITHK
ncbi:MAG: hypothetical protein ACHQET_09285 [Chitinophagales bacterium]